MKPKKHFLMLAALMTLHLFIPDALYAGPREYNPAPSSQHNQREVPVPPAAPPPKNTGILHVADKDFIRGEYHLSINLNEPPILDPLGQLDDALGSAGDNFPNLQAVCEVYQCSDRDGSTQVTNVGDPIPIPFGLSAGNVLVVSVAGPDVHVRPIRPIDQALLEKTWPAGVTFARIGPQPNFPALIAEIFKLNLEQYEHIIVIISAHGGVTSPSTGPPTSTGSVYLVTREENGGHVSGHDVQTFFQLLGINAIFWNSCKFGECLDQL